MAQNAPVKVVANAYLVDGSGKKPAKDAMIIIKGNIIEEAGRTVDAPKGAEVIDGNPMSDISVLQDKEKIRLAMKAGTIEVNRGI